MLSKQTINVFKYGTWIGTHIFFISPFLIIQENKSYKFKCITRASKYLYLFNRSAVISHILLRIGIIAYMGIFLAFVEISVSEKINFFFLTAQCLASSAELLYIHLAKEKFTVLMNSMIVFNRRQVEIFRMPEFVKKSIADQWTKSLIYALIAFGLTIPFMVTAISFTSHKSITFIFTSAEFFNINQFLTRIIFVILGSYFAYIETSLHGALIFCLITHCYFMDQWLQKYLDYFNNEECVPKPEELGIMYRAFQVWNVFVQEFIDVGLTPIVISVIFTIVVAVSGIIFNHKNIEPMLLIIVFSAAILGLFVIKVAIDMANNITTKSLEIIKNFKQLECYRLFYRSCRVIKWKLGLMRIRPATLAIIYEKLVISNVFDVLMLLSHF